MKCSRCGSKVQTLIEYSQASGLIETRSCKCGFTEVRRDAPQDHPVADRQDGGPEFPFPSGPEPKVDAYHERSEGMSLSDWFAAHACEKDVEEIRNAYSCNRFAARWKWADAMLAARGKVNK
jgi:hypothetical protein